MPSKPDLSDSDAMIAFRAECRAYAEHWLNVQREEFKRLGGVGDWAHPYTTMSFDAEATIAAELMKFAMNGLLYRGSKPVMWSVVERTALAEAESNRGDESPALRECPSRFGCGEAETRKRRDLDTSQDHPGQTSDQLRQRISAGCTRGGSARYNWTRRATSSCGGLAGQKGAWRGPRAALERRHDVSHDIVSRVSKVKAAAQFEVKLLAGSRYEDTGTACAYRARHRTEDFEIWGKSHRAEARGIDTNFRFTSTKRMTSKGRAASRASRVTTK